MISKILIDTNVYAFFMRGEEAVEPYFKNSDVLYISAIVIGELFAGFNGGTRIRENKRILEKFISRSKVKVLDVTPETAEIYGEIKAELKKKGTPVPINDVWIAAHAIETGSKLLTYDHHFKKISGVRLWEEIENQ